MLKASFLRTVVVVLEGTIGGHCYRNWLFQSVLSHLVLQSQLPGHRLDRLKNRPHPTMAWRACTIALFRS